jgi:hypothetical protein
MSLLGIIASQNYVRVAKGGFLLGGINSSSARVDTIYKLTFSTDATTTLSATLSTATTSGAGYASTTDGYLAGGSDSGGSLTTVAKLNFATEARTNLGTGLPTGTNIVQHRQQMVILLVAHKAVL